MFVLYLALVCGGGALVASQQTQKQFYKLEQAESYFQEFIQKFGRHYASEYDKQERFEIFKQNLGKINELNQRSEHAVFGITKFSDFTTEELKMYTGLLKESDEPSPLGKCKALSEADVTTKEAPDAYDWRDKAVTGIKDQGGCGSCWAFSTMGNVEGQHAIKHSELVQLSEQQLVDCDDRCLGCQGGFMTYAISKLEEEGGAETSADYPYLMYNDTCQFDQNKIRVKVTGCNAYNITDQEVLKKLLYNTGPLSMSLNANTVQFYQNGILHNECNGELLNHGVVLVGYGTEKNTPYWIVKNSWGYEFGENGYFRLRRGKGENVCCMMNDYMLTAVID